MYYTYVMKGWLKRMTPRFLGLILVLVLVSCGGGSTPLPTLAVDSTPTSLPPAPNRISAEALPKICNCVLRFDRISIEQGLSQSSVHVIFQDSRGFLWFGTQDGLNRYDGYSFKTSNLIPISSPASATAGSPPSWRTRRDTYGSPPGWED